MNPEERLARLESLARKRSDSTPAGYKSVADFHNGIYECTYVSPYSKAAHNLHSNVLIVLQDWISADILESAVIPEAISGGRIPTLPTNRNLDRLVQSSLGLQISETYATNLFPFIKPGGMSASIPFAELRAAARNFTIPQIEILAPKLVVALGLNVYNAIAVETNNPRRANLSDAISHPFNVEGSKVWCQGHPGALGQNGRNRYNKKQTELDWLEMRDWYKRNAA